MRQSEMTATRTFERTTGRPASTGARPPRSHGAASMLALQRSAGNTSTTALQALNLLTSEFILRQASLFAVRLEKEAGADPARQADRGFALAFGRSPSSVERNSSAALIRAHGTEAFCRALYNANEFVFAP